MLSFGDGLQLLRNPTERDLLLAWYDAHKRDLPWRRTRDPYAIWVSEIMLQQTRVDTVIPYYERFLARFPTPHALAAADPDAVMSAWSGLGYYRRARLLHAGVREVVARYGGVVPRDPEARAELPGIGRYTNGAIGSIAFQREEPIVDGNVARVLARVRGIDAELGSKEAERAFWSEAEALVPGERPGDLNQALMELGATVCTKSTPRCGECPLAKRCVARIEERVDVLPVAKKRRAPKRVETIAVLAVDDAGAIYLERGERALFGGLYGLPMREGGSRRDALELLAERSIEAKLARTFARVEHVLTHRVLDVRVFLARDARATRRFYPPTELAEIGVAKLTHKLVGAVLPQMRATSKATTSALPSK